MLICTVRLCISQGHKTKHSFTHTNMFLPTLSGTFSSYNKLIHFAIAFSKAGILSKETCEHLKTK